MDVTVSLPEDLLREARQRAVSKDVSLSADLVWILREQMLKDRAYEEAMRRDGERMNRGLPIGTQGQITWTRDELHDR